MIDQLNEILEAIIEDERLSPNVAILMKQLFDELIKIGFTEDQAIQIVENYKATGWLFKGKGENK